MDLKNKTKEQLKDICDEKSIHYSVTDTKKALVEKIETFETIEATCVVSGEEASAIVDVIAETVTQEEATELVNDGEAVIGAAIEIEGFQIKYKSKGRWIELGEFNTIREAKKAIKRCGSQEVDIIPIIKK